MLNAVMRGKREARIDEPTSQGNGKPKSRNAAGVSRLTNPDRPKNQSFRLLRWSRVSVPRLSQSIALTLRRTYVA